MERSSKPNLIQRINPAVRYILDAVSVAAVTAFVLLISSSVRNPITGKLTLNPDALDGSLHTHGLGKLFGLTFLTGGIGIPWLVCRVVYFGNNEYRTVWLLTKIGYGPRLQQSFERTGKPPEMAEWLARAGYNKEEINWRGWWRYAVAFVLIALMVAQLRSLR
ncbi:MAG: hypothetical protein EPO08_09495 [Rhodospirillaceae bacterium]|nr:MAG: hypothetical protein EPO08_09495 [Rhodospirillaceae bacterium]